MVCIVTPLQTTGTFLWAGALGNTDIHPIEAHGAMSVMEESCYVGVHMPVRIHVQANDLIPLLMGGRRWHDVVMFMVCCHSTSQVMPLISLQASLVRGAHFKLYSYYVFIH